MGFAFFTPPSAMPAPLCAISPGLALRYALLQAGLFPSLAFAQGNAITDPIPSVPPLSAAGITLVEFAQLPESFGQSARVNMMKPLPHPDGEPRYLVIDQRGWLYHVDGDGDVRAFLQLRDAVFATLGVPLDPVGNFSQAGSTSFAVHPEYLANGLIWFIASVPADEAAAVDFPVPRPILTHTGAPAALSHHDVLFLLRDDDPTDRVFTGMLEEVIRWEQPFDDHNVGEVAFNPTARPGDADYGLLYLAVADGGSDGFPIRNVDPLDLGQNRLFAHGSILRIDPLGHNSANGRYGLPADNPFLGDPHALPEIYAWGLRNPHRLSWDLDNGTLYTFDIGQWFIEEVNLIEPGLNYGWGEREGTWVIEENNEFALFPLPPFDAFTYPVLMWDHPGTPENPRTGQGAIAGGQVVRAWNLPELEGYLLTADFTTDGRFFLARAEEMTAAHGSLAPAALEELRLYDAAGRRQSPSQLFNGRDGQRTDVRFHLDPARGTLFVSSKRNGRIYRVTSAPDVPGVTMADNVTNLELGPAGTTAEIGLVAEAPQAVWRIDTHIEPAGAAAITFHTPTRGTGEAIVIYEVLPNDGNQRATIEIVLNGADTQVITQEGRFSIERMFATVTRDNDVPDRVRVGWLGLLDDVDQSPWMRHREHGWIYVAENDGTTHWFRDLALNAWWYTTPTTYPWLYLAERDAWFFYQVGSPTPERWFYDANQAAWRLERTL